MILQMLAHASDTLHIHDDTALALIAACVAIVLSLGIWKALHRAKS